MEQEKVSALFTEIWRLARDSGFKKLSNEEWEIFVANKRKIYEKYKGTELEKLALDMARSVESYYERIQRNEK